MNGDSHIVNVERIIQSYIDIKGLETYRKKVFETICTAKPQSLLNVSAPASLYELGMEKKYNKS